MGGYIGRHLSLFPDKDFADKSRVSHRPTRFAPSTSSTILTAARKTPLFLNSSLLTSAFLPMKPRLLQPSLPSASLMSASNKLLAAYLEVGR